MDKIEYLKDLCVRAKKAQRKLALADDSKRSAALRGIASKLRDYEGYLISENEKDLAAAANNGVTAAMCDRLRLSHERINDMASSAEKLSMLSDPLGDAEENVRPNGLRIVKSRVPLGNVAMIYEARPNVTVDAAALCVKSGNAVILRGGKEAYNTNAAIELLIKKALSETGIPEDAVSLVHDVTRESSSALMTLRGYIDVLIPRGSAALIKSVVENAKVPVIETGAGNCHVYVDRTADPEMAKKVALSAKISRPSVCNAEEKLLVHADIAEGFLPEMIKLYRENGVEVRGDERAARIVPDVIPATPDDLTREYNDYIVTVYVVDSTDAAIEHINKYNTGHSEAIITEDAAAAEKFQSEVDAAAVYVNASTRFTDGGEFGLGAEIGISTQKLHTRGPFALEALTTVKYKITGNGQVR